MSSAHSGRATLASRAKQERTAVPYYGGTSVSYLHVQVVRSEVDHHAVPAGDPKHPLPFPFRELSDDEFDELVYLVAHVADPKLVKTRAPDGGLDTVRLAEDDPLHATWGIQAKLHRDQIKWPDCKGSLDRAVDQWKAPTYYSA